jgi:hypothetical protein
MKKADAVIVVVREWLAKAENDLLSKRWPRISEMGETWGFRRMTSRT